MSAELERLADVSRRLVVCRRERDGLIRASSASLRELARASGLSVEGVRRIRLSQVERKGAKS